MHNLRANPQAHVEVGTDAYDVNAHELPQAERDEIFAKVVAAAPNFGKYQAEDEAHHPAVRAGSGVASLVLSSPIIATGT